MNEETEADRFVRQLLADEPHEKMPEDVFQRLDAVAVSYTHLTLPTSDRV